MFLSERHIIKSSNPLFKELDHLCFLSKNLFNASTYAIRQYYFNNKLYLNKFQLINEFTQNFNPDYIALPRKASQQVIYQVDQSFQSFFKLLKLKSEGKYDKPIKLPYYKDKTKGRNILVYTNQAISHKKLKQGVINPSGTSIEIKTKQQHINQVRIVPRKNYFVIEVLYEVQEKDNANLDQSKYASIDLGVDNLASIVSNNSFRPFIINGKPLKSINHYYNKQLSFLKSQQDLSNNKERNKRKLSILTNKRNNKINDYMHKASRLVVNQLVSNKVSNLVIGYNKEWKQESSMSRQNNQNFVQIPHRKFIQMLQYKCKLEAINVILQEESYSSKCSFIDNEPVKKHDEYKGRRIKRGLFTSSEGFVLNADINGALNILRKAVPNIFDRINIKEYRIKVCNMPIVYKTMK